MTTADRFIREGREAAKAMFDGRKTGLFEINIYWPDTDSFSGGNGFDAYEDFSAEARTRMAEAETIADFLQAIADDFDRLAATSNYTYAVDEEGETDYDNPLSRGFDYWFTVDYRAYNADTDDYTEDCVSIGEGVIDALIKGTED